MLLAFTAIDYAILGFYLVLMIAIGAYFSREQHDSEDFFLAGRSMGWFPVGLSVMATLLSALSYTGVPGEAYHVGFKLMLQPLAIWLTVPLMFWLVMPLYYHLRLTSVYEYLEMRFSLGVRAVSSAAFVLWRLLWMGGVLYAPCKVLALAAGWEEQLPALIIGLGIISTAYTFLGGMKAVIWTDVIQSLIMLLGLVAIIGGVWIQIDGGGARIWQIAGDMGRTALVQATPQESFWSDRWLVWGILPHFFFAMISFYIADQITVQRFFTAASLPQLKRSFLLNCVSITIMSCGLTYAGVALLAYYQSHPQDMNPYWVARLADDPATGKPLVDSTTGRPYVERTTDVQAELEELIAVGALLDPNTQQPLASKELVADSSGKLVVENLAQRDPRTGEVLVVRGNDELMPRFLINFLPAGFAGLIFAALLAASMSSMDSALNSVATLVIADFYRRLGVGRDLIAALRRKSAAALDDHDELWIGRWLVLLIGVAATLFSLWVARLGNIFDIMLNVVNTFGAPLLGVFLLGMFTRRTTAAGALAALYGGALATLWLSLGPDWGLWPFATRFNPIWSITFGLAVTLLIGYAASFALGRPKTTAELTGLVWRLGKLGHRPAPLETAVDEEARWQ